MVVTKLTRARAIHASAFAAASLAGLVLVPAVAQAGDSSWKILPRIGMPAILTAASPNTGIGGELSDQAVVTDLADPAAAANVTFRLYPPADTTCSGAAVFTNVQAVTRNGSVATAASDAYAPTENGVYRWVATYDGDASNALVSGVCNDVSEVALVGDAALPPPQPPPPPVLPDIALFTGSPTTLRVSKTGAFTYRFIATPGRAGKAQATSAKAIKIGSQRHKVKVASKSFTAPASALVKVKFKLTARNLKALKLRTSLKFKLSVSVGSEKFSAKFKLKPPKRS